MGEAKKNIIPHIYSNFMLLSMCEFYFGNYRCTIRHTHTYTFASVLIHMCIIQIIFMCINIYGCKTQVKWRKNNQSKVLTEYRTLVWHFHIRNFSLLLLLIGFTKFCIFFLNDPWIYIEQKHIYIYIAVRREMGWDKNTNNVKYIIKQFKLN